MTLGRLNNVAALSLAAIFAEQLSTRIPLEESGGFVSWPHASWELSLRRQMLC